MTSNDGCERVGQVGVRIDGVEFAGFDQGGDDAPVCGSSIVTSKERILAAQGDWTDRAFDRVIVHLDTPVGQEEAKSLPVFGDVFERLTQGCFGRDAGAVGFQPRFKIGNQWCCPVLPYDQSGFGCQAPDIFFDAVEGSDLL